MQRTLSSVNLQTLLTDGTPVTLLDVRRSDDRAQMPAAIPGSTWCDPGAVDDWSANLNRDQKIVLYCVRGGSVSNSMADALHAKGFDARYIEGGLEAWQSAGGTTTTQT